MKNASRALTIALVLAPVTTAGAQMVTVGTPTAITVYPFNALNVAGYTRYQQVYRAGAFASTGGPINITSLNFFSPSSAGYIDNLANYVVRLSTTPRPVNGLLPTFNANVGADVQTFFSGMVAPGALSILGATPFFYDPSAGNLLLDVAVSGQGDQGYFLKATTNGDVSSLYGNNPGPGFASTTGLVTQFVYTSAIAPEPTSCALMATGLLGVLAVSRRRRPG